MRYDFLIVLALAVTSCGSHRESGSDTDSTIVAIDTVYSPNKTSSLIDKAGATASGLSQHEYAEMIEQCRALNRKVASKLADMHFTRDMTDEQIEAAMNKLQNDPEVPVLEEQSRKLLLILQNADLNPENRERYARMVADAEASLRRLDESYR